MILDHRTSISKSLTTVEGKSPPPYAERSIEEIPDHALLHVPATRLPSASMLLRAYGQSTSSFHSVSSSRPSILSPENLPDLPPEASTVNHLHVQTRSKDLTGTYYLDPCLPIHSKKLGQKSNASFRSRHGNIILSLATVCPHADQAKTQVGIQTDTGEIIISLLDMSLNQNISLDLSSRRGNISLLIPPSFFGVLQLRTRKGSVNFLPALSAVMRVLKDAEEEVLVMIGNSKSIGDSTGANFCQLSSRFGKMTIGLKGQDKVMLPAPKFWTRLGQQLRGEIATPECIE